MISCLKLCGLPPLTSYVPSMLIILNTLDHHLRDLKNWENRDDDVDNHPDDN